MADQSHVLEPDAQAIFLLCGRFGSHGESSAKPLTQNQYNEVANWLNQNGMRPSDLLEESGREQLSAFGGNGKITETRLRELLGRGAALAMVVEEWTNKGGWILARSDEDYPSRFRKRLRHLAPPILYGIGDRTHLEYGGASMVGSRDSDEAALSFIRDLARSCADQGIAVVSGGARGVDQASMDAALEAGGTVVGALANGLAKTARKKKYREAIADNRLTLVSAYHPDSGFQVWKAMERNKHIYCLSDGAIVAHSAHGSGGTWSGATENLKHGWVPLSVLAEAPIPEGNQKLIERGGRPVDRRLLRPGVNLNDWLFTNRSITDIPSPIQAFAGKTRAQRTRQEEREGSETLVSEEQARVYLEESESSETELFPLVWPLLKSLLREARGEQYVREYFADLRLCQARDWLLLAVERGLAIREEEPVRYSLPAERENSCPTSNGNDEETDADGTAGVGGDGQVSGESESGGQRESRTLFEEEER